MFMDTEVEDARVFLENMLGAIPMVDVKVDNENLLYAVAAFEVSCCDRYVVEVAKPHRLGPLGMVSWGADCTKPAINLFGHDCFNVL
jgi:hypothetical protein